MKFQSFTGTAQEFIKAGVTVNGATLDTASFSILARYGIAKMQGLEVKADPSKRGRCGSVYKLQGHSGFVVKVPVQNVVEEQQKELIQA